jgi:hypothetical protein
MKGTVKEIFLFLFHETASPYALQFSITLWVHLLISRLTEVGLAGSTTP